MLEALIASVLLGLVTYRLTRFVIKDTMINGFRHWLLNKLLGVKPNVVRQKLHDLLSCPHCSAGWIALGCVGVTLLVSPVPKPIGVWLGAWAVHELLWRKIEMPNPVNMNVTNLVRHRDDKFSND